MRIRVSARIYPTEDERQVKRAILSVFPDARLEKEGDILTGEASGVERFREVIRSRRIRDTIEEILEGNYSSGKTWIDLNKQDALKGIVNVCEDSPLGCLHVEFFLERDEIKELVWGSKNGDRGEV